ncbi:hypothetical protein Glove_634g25 [Diversispora epigaea]|uniref:Uncharacterized protein n=1 Tax=Diversispora epigaea TaxID=1348612 RepID=A0A397G910_9GLOM|nr:hypothetical protein Glove_634g25 [Diversispora epigaea]
MQKTFSNPDKVEKLLLIFAIGVIEIILNSNNEGLCYGGDKIENGNIYISSFLKSEKDNNDNMNEDNEDVNIIYIDFNEENDINLFQMDDKVKWNKKLSMFITLLF